MIPKEELAEHSRWHSEQESKGVSSNNPEIIPEDIGIGTKPRSIPRRKITNFSIVFYAVLLIIIGLAFLLGIAKYWFLIPIGIGLVIIIGSFQRKK
jgi:hypothetical protein